MKISFSRKFTVCYFGTYRSEYSRNRNMISALRKVGVNVIECHEPLWSSISEREELVKKAGLDFCFLTRLIRAYFRLIVKYLRIPEHNIVIVGYPGQLDVFIAKMLCQLKRKPLIWDVFMSINLIALERGLQSYNPIGTKILFLLEKLACRVPDRLIIDTPEYGLWFSNRYSIQPNVFRYIPTGTDEQIFFPITNVSEKSRFVVLYYGTFIPNHGVPYIIEAAKYLKDDPQIIFKLIGDGPEKQKTEELVAGYGLQQVIFSDWMETKDLVKEISSASICLGAFGFTPQSVMTIQNKIYEAMAMQKAVISGDSEAVRRNFKHAISIYLTDRNDPKSLADAIRLLKEDDFLRNKIATNGFQEFKAKYSLEKMGKCFLDHLNEFYFDQLKEEKLK